MAEKDEVSKMSLDELQAIVRLACNLEHFVFPDSAQGLGNDVAFIRRREVEELESRCKGALARVTKTPMVTSPPPLPRKPRTSRLNRTYSQSDGAKYAFPRFEEGATVRQVLRELNQLGVMTKRNTDYNINSVNSLFQCWKRSKNDASEAT